MADSVYVALCSVHACQTLTPIIANDSAEAAVTRKVFELKRMKCSLGSSFNITPVAVGDQCGR